MAYNGSGGKRLCTGTDLDVERSKGVPLTKDEVALLITLIEGCKVITTKATNATNNKLKEVAWSKLTDVFNSSICSFPRRTDQLRLKWENLKKAARKRSQKIRTLQAGDYIPRDDLLDRVSAILDSTGEEYTLPSGDDSELLDSTVDADDAKMATGDWSGGEGGSGAAFEGEGEEEGQVRAQPEVFLSTPMANYNSAKKRRKLLEEDIKARTTRNNAIAEYYFKKKEKIELEMENLKLQNSKLKQELGITEDSPQLRLEVKTENNI